MINPWNKIPKIWLGGGSPVDLGNSHGEGGSVETEVNPHLQPYHTLPLRTGTSPQTPPLSQFQDHHSPWGPGGGTPGGTAPGCGAPAGGCCCGPTADPACPSCSEGPRLPGGAPLPAGAGATEAGARAKPWAAGGPAAPGGGTGWEPGGGCGGCWCICWKCCCRARISAYFSCSMWKACLSASSCCLWYSSCREDAELSAGGRKPKAHTLPPTLSSDKPSLPLRRSPHQTAALHLASVVLASRPLSRSPHPGFRLPPWLLTAVDKWT